MTTPKTTFLILIILQLLLPFITIAENPKLDKKRKTVAVVLSGGGAKGVAHIGVLKALEEQGIAIDYIAGTSVGAMVGGMYAAGYTPDEILELMSSEEFANASMGRLGKEHNFYFFNNDPTPTWLSFNYSLKQLLNFQSVLRENLPSNLISPGMMDFMFMQYLSPASVAARNNFDSLFIPFRCVASDITNKKAIVMGSGNLSESVRASMTFPFYFKPIIIDSIVLFDGGMFNNFPVDVAIKDFNPDIIIGSVVASNPNPPNVHDLLSQLENMLMVASDYNLPEGAKGIVLYPKVPDLGVTDFSKNTMVFRAGYREVKNNLDSILKLNPGIISSSELQSRRENFRNSIPENEVADIRLTHGSTDGGEFARVFLKPNKSKITMTELQANYYRLLSIDKFRHIYPRLHFNQIEDFYELELDLLKNYPFHRSFGGNLSSQSINQFFAEFSYQKLGKYPISVYNNFFVGNIYNSGKIGVRVDFLRKLPFYLMAETSISRWDYATETVFLFEEQKPSFINQNEFLADLRVVIPSGYKGKWETGAFLSSANNRYYNTSFFSRTDTTDHMRIRPIGFYFSRETNTLNHVQYPTKGSFFNIRGRLMSATEEYDPGNTSFQISKHENYHQWWEASLKWENFFYSHPWFRPAIISELFISNRPLLANFSASRIMAQQYSPFPLASTRYLDSFRANHYAAAGLKSVFLLSRTLHFQMEAHAFHSFREIFQDVDHSARYIKNRQSPSFMYHTALVLHTPMGPLSAGLSYFGNEESPLAFVINFGYILFNRKSF